MSASLPRLAIVLSHPVQYYSPWFRWLRAHTSLEFRVFYLWEFGVRETEDPQFGTAFKWDVDLISGYEHEFVPNVARDPGTHHFRGLDNPALTTRLAAYAPNNGLMAPNTNRVIPVKDGRDGAGAVVAADVVPAGATAVAINVTVASPTGPNFLSVLPGDAVTYTASTINWPGGFDAANGATVKLDASRQLKVFCGDQAGSTHVIIDVAGYYL